MDEALRVAVVEDEPQYRERLEALAKCYGKKRQITVTVDLFENGFAFLSQYEAGYDAVFMDILMPHMDGMETARRLRKLDEEVPIIFATTVAQYAIQGYEVWALGFMLKPVSYEEFEIKMDRIRRNSRRGSPVTYPIAQDGRLTVVPLREIRYVEVMNHSLIFHTGSGCFTVSGQLTNLENDSRFSRFAKCSPSHLVNCAWVTEVGADTITVDGSALPLSRRRRKGFLQEMARILGGNC